VPFTFTGGRLVLNAWTRFRGDVRVDLADATEETMSSPAKTIDGRSFEDCDPITGNDQLNHAVTWKGDSDISGWEGRPVRLRFRMRRARLYAIRFAGERAGV
jgi:hypothetical protein